MRLPHNITYKCKPVSFWSPSPIHFFLSCDHQHLICEQSRIMAPTKSWRVVYSWGLIHQFLVRLIRKQSCTLSLLPLLNSEVHTARVLLTDRSGQTGAVRYQWKSNLNSNFAVQTVRTGIPVDLTGNRPNSIFFLFWFKFKCPQSILNECLYNMF